MIAFLLPKALPALEVPKPALPQLTTLQLVLVAVAVLLVLWIAYRVGQIVLRIAAGLLFLGAAGYVLWYLFIR